MVEINNTTKKWVSIKKTKLLVEKFFKYYREKDWDVSIAVVNDRVIKKLNKEYRQIDKVTDILSFRGDELMGKHQGEIIINIDETGRVENYKDVFKKKPTEQHVFNFILIHGLLHLIGFNDDEEKDREEMLELGRQFLNKTHL